MASMTYKAASIRIVNAEKKSVCTVNDVLPTVDANTAEEFVSAIETLYNNGPCTAQIRMIYDLVN